MHIAQVPVNKILCCITYSVVPFIEGSRMIKTDAGERNQNTAAWRGGPGDMSVGLVRECAPETHQRNLGA